MEKTFINSYGNILVRQSSEIGCGIVEMLYLYDKNESGCVIAAWYLRKVAEGSSPIAELQSIADRIVTTKYDHGGILLEAITFGQKLADLLIACGKVKNKPAEENQQKNSPTI